jgi:hypothetical protein
LGYLRRQREYNMFDMLHQGCQTSFENFQLEHPILTQIFQNLVLKGSFEACENLIEKAMEQNLFQWYYQTQCNYKCKWYPVQKKGENYPRMRGGHQICLDSKNGDYLYLYGGWDGRSDLGDTWRYDIKNETWTCLHENSDK